MTRHIIVEMHLNLAAAGLRGHTLTPQEARDLMLQVRDVAETIIQCVDPTKSVEELASLVWPHDIRHTRRQLAGSDTPVPYNAGADTPTPEREP